MRRNPFITRPDRDVPTRTVPTRTVRTRTVTVRTRTAAIGAAAIVLVAVLAGCTASGGSGSQSGTADGVAQAPDIGGVVPGTAPVQEFDSSKDGGTATTPVDTTADRSIITTGWMTITVDDPSDATDETEKIVAEAGGRIDARQEYAAADGRPSTATLTLRIPSSKLADALDALGELGQVESLTQDASDVTVQRQDLDARITALRGSIDRFEALVSTAASLDDLITLETAIADRQAELESLEAQQRGLEDQVSMSTITATFQAESVAPPRTPGTFLDGLATGWEAFVGFWAALLVVAGVLVPWLVSAAIIVFVVMLIVRRSRRRTGIRGAGRIATPQLAGIGAADGPGTRVADSAVADDLSSTTDPEAGEPRS